jgi:hypothetical protein
MVKHAHKTAKAQTGESLALEELSWSRLLRVRPRYQRSVHLGRDLKDANALDGYHLTPLAKSVLNRIADGLEPASRARAWSLTGPFGSGKSSLALLLAQAFAAPTVITRGARQMVAHHAPDLCKELFGRLLGCDDGLLPVIAVGDRRSLDAILLESLVDALRAFWAKESSDLLDRVESAAKRTKSQAIPAREVADLFVQAAAMVHDADRAGKGLLVILDEAGKALEHAALNPSRGDVLLLQELGEAAARSGGTPLVFVVLLHQSFDRYASRLGSTERNEWSKVQGRFEDIPFQEANEQLLRLVGAALEKKPLPPTVSRILDSVALDVARLVKLSGVKPRLLQQMLSSTAPLHPCTALALGVLFRSRIFQNERSLFAFLATNEPKGFMEFIRRPIDLGEPLFTLDRLYDYVVTTLGPRIYSGESQAWAQTEAALRRLPQNADATDARVLKTVGILAALGEATGLVASQAVIAVAISDGRAARTREAVLSSIKRLEAASILVHRRYSDAYQIWEGSDLDLDALVGEAHSRIDPSASLTKRLERIAKPRPVVARRHFFQTGTLRYFEVRFGDECLLAGSLNPADPSADGVIFLVLPASNAATERLRSALKVAGGRRAFEGLAHPVLVGLPRNVEEIRGLSFDLAALEWVQSNTPQLQSDPVARRELSGRIAEADRLLRRALGSLLGGANTGTWHHVRGDEVVRSSRDLARVVSDLCDQLFASAPYIHNELLNRRNLSSAAAAARRSLVEAMVEKPQQKSLGIEGTPPELSMYRSLLEHHGLHRVDGDVGKFGEPRNRKQGSLKPAYEHIQKMLNSASGTRLALEQVYEQLRAAPFGLKDGPIPVLVMAALVEPGADIAIYEDGAFVPQLTGAIAERLLRGPSKFQVQRFRVAGARAELFQELIGPETWASGKVRSLLPLVKQLVRLARDLPDYSRNTRSVSEHALAVREVLLRAKEPGPLVFTDLPRACGFEPLSETSDLPKAKLDELVARLKTALRELQSAYPHLLNTIESELRNTFSLPTIARAARTELSARAKQLMPMAVETQLKGFLIRVADDAIDHDAWVESIGTLLGGRPPATWHDRDSEAFAINLAQVSRRFATVEAFAVERGGMQLAEGTKLLRLSVAEPGMQDQERVVAVRTSDQKHISALAEELRRLVAGQQDISKDAVLAALAYVARDVVTELSATDQFSAEEKRP